MLIPADPVHAFIDYPPVAVPNAAGGPLSGLTFAVKDIYDVAGYPTGCGNPLKRAQSPPAATSAPVVDALLNAGARFVGKTHTAELAFSLDGRNSHYGTPLNPAAPGRVPGGSSSGSAAAVAAKLCDIALGSDTGGSVRGPASFCGIVGLRPTQARIDIGGTMPLAPSFDTAGWFSRDIDVFQRVGAVLLREDKPGPALVRLAAADDAFALLVDNSAGEALAPSVAHVEARLGKARHVTVAERESLGDWQQVFRTVQGFEAWRAHGPWVLRHWADLTAPVRTRFELASAVSASAYRAANDRRAKIRRRVTEVVGEDGVMVLPTLPTIAPKVDASDEEFEAFRTRGLSMLCMAGLAGLPQLSLPLATVDGCPLGLSLVGPAGRDRALIALAREIFPELTQAPGR